MQFEKQKVVLLLTRRLILILLWLSATCLLPSKIHGPVCLQIKCTSLRRLEEGIYSTYWKLFKKKMVVQMSSAGFRHMFSTLWIHFFPLKLWFQSSRRVLQDNSKQPCDRLKSLGCKLLLLSPRPSFCPIYIVTRSVWDWRECLEYTGSLHLLSRQSWGAVKALN